MSRSRLPPNHTFPRSWHRATWDPPRHSAASRPERWSVMKWTSTWVALSIWPAEVELHHRSLTYIAPETSQKVGRLHFLCWCGKVSGPMLKLPFESTFKGSTSTGKDCRNLNGTKSYTKSLLYRSKPKQSDPLFAIPSNIKWDLTNGPRTNLLELSNTQVYGSVPWVLPTCWEKTIMCLHKHQLVGANLDTVLLYLIQSYLFHDWNKN